MRINICFFLVFVFLLANKDIIIVSELEAVRPSRYYRLHLTQFGVPCGPEDSAAYLEVEGAMQFLAWIVRHFVGSVVENPKTFWRTIRDNRPIEKCFTSSDLAFTVLVLEQHIMQWRHTLHYELETGTKPAQQHVNIMGSLLYDDGISGSRAKQRFNELSIFFFQNFFSRETERSLNNMHRLGTLVAELAAYDHQLICAWCEQCGRSPVELSRREEVLEEIIHQVFYYIHS